MSTHISFLKRLTELTRNHSVLWSHSVDSCEYVAHVDNYAAAIAYPKGGARGIAPNIRFTLYRRDEVVVDLSTRKLNDFQTSDDSTYPLKSLFEAVQRQQASRETAALEDFLTRAEA